jgi:uncharacterized lipoprotein YmbA
MKHAAWLIPLLLLTACGSSPKTHFYTLVPVPPAQTGQAGAKSGSTAAGPPVQVGHVALPGTLDRLSVVTRGAGARIEVSDQDRWAAPLDELVRRALTADLRDRLGAGRVLAPGEPAPPGGVRTVAVTVQQFIGDASGHVVLTADWTVATCNARTPGPNPHAALEVDAGSANADSVAAAMSHALGQFADQIAAAL